MSRRYDFEEIKSKLDDGNLTLVKSLDLADDLVSHVEYWMNAERAGTKYLAKKLKEVSEQTEQLKSREE